MNHSRIDYIDIAKGIGILLVYVGHCYIGGESSSYDKLNIWIYSFHMPLFFMISGMLFPRRFIDKRLYIYKKTVSLILPYLLFSMVNYVVLKVLHMGPPNFILSGWGRNPLWFIPILYLIEVLHYFIVKGKSWEMLLSGSIIASLFVWKTHCNGWLPYSISELPWFYLCFLSGYLSKPKLMGIIQSNRNIVIPIILMSVQSLVLFFVVLPYNVNYRQQDNDALSYIMRYCLGIVGSLSILMISSKVNQWRPFLIIKWIGENTLVILCTHLLYYRLLQTFNYQPFLRGGVNHIFIWFLIIITIFIYNKYINPLIEIIKRKYDS